jgi:hypothetical protein
VAAGDKVVAAGDKAVVAAGDKAVAAGAAEEWVGALEARVGLSAEAVPFPEAVRSRNRAWDAGGREDAGRNAGTAG